MLSACVAVCCPTFMPNALTSYSQFSQQAQTSEVEATLMQLLSQEVTYSNRSWKARNLRQGNIPYNVK